MDYATSNPPIHPSLHTFQNPNTTHPTQFQHEQQNDRHTFAQAFSNGMKIEFPKFDGENPVDG
jgi:hypothetical protein